MCRTFTCQDSKFKGRHFISFHEKFFLLMIQNILSHVVWATNRQRLTLGVSHLTYATLIVESLLKAGPKRLIDFWQVFGLAIHISKITIYRSGPENSIFIGYALQNLICIRR